METCLKYLLPLSCVLLLGAALWQIAMPDVVLMFLKYVVALVCLGLVIVALYRIVTTPSRLPFPSVTEMGGGWKVDESARVP